MKKQISNVSVQKQNDLSKLAAPAQRALAAAGVRRLSQLTKFSEEEVKQWHGIGPNALTELRRAMNEKGLSFRDGKDAMNKRRTNP